MDMKPRELWDAIWVGTKALEETQNIRQEHLKGCEKKIVMLYINDLRVLVESAQREFQREVDDTLKKSRKYDSSATEGIEWGG